MSIFTRLFGTNRANKPTDAEPMRFYVGLEIEVVPLQGKARKSLSSPVVIDVTPIEAPRAIEAPAPKARQKRKGKVIDVTPIEAPRAADQLAPEPIKIHREGFAKIEITNPLVFARDLATLKTVTPARTPKKVLKNIVVESFNDTSVKAYATDIECSIALDMGGVFGASPGKFCVDLDALTQATKASKGKTVFLSQTDDGLSVSNGNSSRTLPLETDLSQFPDLPNYPVQASIALDMVTMLRMISRTVHAADPSNIRFAMGGVFLELLSHDSSSMQINAVATNGKSLERETTYAPIDKLSPNAPMTAIIPMKTLKLIERFKEAKEVAFTFSDKDIFFSIPDRAMIHSRCIEGRFPRYQDVFPNGCDASLSIADDRTRLELSKALADAAKFISADANRAVEFSIDVKSISIIASHSEDGATSLWKVAIPRHDGPRVKASIDPSYLSEAIRSHDSPVALEFGTRNPIVVRSETHDSIIMPMTRDPKEWNPGNPECKDPVVIEGINDRDKSKSKQSA